MTQHALDAAVDIVALKKRATIEDIYNQVNPDVTQARQAMLYAMERHDRQGIADLIQTLEERISVESKNSPRVGYYMARQTLDTPNIQALRAVITIGQLVLRSLSPGAQSNDMALPLRKWDA